MEPLLAFYLFVFGAILTVFGLAILYLVKTAKNTEADEKESAQQNEETGKKP